MLAPTSHVSTDSTRRSEVVSPLTLLSRGVTLCSSELLLLVHTVVLLSVVEVLPTASHRAWDYLCLLYTSPSPRDRQKSRMPSSA